MMGIACLFAEYRLVSCGVTEHIVCRLAAQHRRSSVKMARVAVLRIVGYPVVFDAVRMMTLIVAAVAVAPGIVIAAELTVEERAAGIAAVEKLRHGSRLGAQVPVFEQNYPDEIWRDRSMELGALLDAASARHGFTEIVAALDQEARRIGNRSRGAGYRLDAMRAALGHEPSKIRECLVLPRVAHMLDELIAGDRPAHGVDGPKSELWEWWVSPMVFEGRQFHTAVWTGNEMIVWGGSFSGNPASDTGGPPRPRGRHVDGHHPDRRSGTLLLTHISVDRR